MLKKTTKDNYYFYTNLFFSFLPISFIIGSSIINASLILVCCFGIYHLRSKILTTKFDFPIKIIFLFFLVVFFSTSLNFFKILFTEGYAGINLLPFCYSTNCFTPLEKLIKSILFFRFFIFLLIIYLLNKSGILQFKYFFLTAAFSSLLIALDIIYQYFVGHNIIGLTNTGFINSGFFGDEHIAGGYIQKFSFFAICFVILAFQNKNYNKFLFTILVVCILGTGILLSGNRVPFFLFIFGLFLLLISNLKIAKIILTSVLALIISLKFVISSNPDYKAYIEGAYSSFYGSAKNIVSKPLQFDKYTWNKVETIQEGNSLKKKTRTIEVPYESNHRRLFLTAIDTWKKNKIFGNGIKSFREDCWKLIGPGFNLGEDLLPGKKNRLCSNHPHNYYFEILTETGLVGFIIIIIIAFMFMNFIFKNLGFVKKINSENYILLVAIICLILETLPLRSTGSIFSTNNAAYIMIISSIILCNKKLMRLAD